LRARERARRERDPTGARRASPHPRYEGPTAPDGAVRRPGGRRLVRAPPGRGVARAVRPGRLRGCRGRGLRRFLLRRAPASPGATAAPAAASKLVGTLEAD